MNARPSDAVPPDAPRSRRRPWRIASIIAGVLLLGLAAPAVPVKQVESRIDAVTGSMRWKTVWLFGMASGPRVDVSPLETRLRRSGITWTPSWRFLHNTHRNIFGGATCYECGSAPPIYQLRPMLEDFAAGATDAQLREFVSVMQSGTRAEQQAAVDAATEAVWELLSARPGG